MINPTVDRASLRLSATLLLVGQLLYVVVTLLHTGGEANHHAAIFAAYAASATWTAVHVAQFACMAIMLAGLFALFSTLDVQAGRATLAARLGTAFTTATLALYGVVLAVDGVALKQAVSAWATAPDAEKAARFAAAETMRWLEWGARSYENFTLGLAVLFAAAVVRRAPISRPIAYLMGFSGLTSLVQGWLAGAEGFSETHTLAIVIAEVLNAMWMTWLLIAAWRIPRASVCGWRMSVTHPLVQRGSRLTSRTESDSVASSYASVADCRRMRLCKGVRVLAAVLLAVGSGFQVLLAAGLPLGHPASGGADEVTRGKSVNSPASFVSYHIECPADGRIFRE